MPHASCRLEGKSAGDGPLFRVAADDSEGEGRGVEVWQSREFLYSLMFSAFH